MSNLRDQIQHLTPPEKLELLDMLWQSIEEDKDALPLTDEQRAELEHRIALYEANPAAVLPWEEVRADLFKTP